MVHYAENAAIKVSNIVNCGIYYFSVRIFAEYGLNPYPDEDFNADGGENTSS